MILLTTDKFIRPKLVPYRLSNRGCIVGLFLAIFMPWMARSSSAEMVIDFNELAGYTTTGPSGSYFDGYGFGAAAGTWQSQGVTFNTGNSGQGWSYSNVNDSTTAGFTNQWAAFKGTGIGGSGNYAIGTSFGPNEAFFNLPVGQNLISVSVTNTTYTALSILNGDSFAKKFGGMLGSDPDFLRVTFTGFGELNATGATTGSVEFFLADYRFANNSLDYVVNDWRMVDLTSLGNARSLGISFDGTDNHPTLGLNTPAYVAIDNLTVSAIPEPSSLALSSLAVALAFAKSRRRHGFKN